jgi:hypothetical protein
LQGATPFRLFGHVHVLLNVALILLLQLCAHLLRHGSARLKGIDQDEPNHKRDGGGQDVDPQRLSPNPRQLFEVAERRHPHNQRRQNKRHRNELEEVQENRPERRDPVAGELAPSGGRGDDPVDEAEHEPDDNLPVKLLVPGHKHTLLDAEETERALCFS